MPTCLHLARLPRRLEEWMTLLHSVRSAVFFLLLPDFSYSRDEGTRAANVLSPTGAAFVDLPGCTV